MPAGLQTVTFFAHSLGSTGSFVALDPATGDSDTFFNVPQDTLPFLAEVWAVDDTSAALISLHGTRFHDQSIGMLGNVPPASTVNSEPVSSVISPTGADQRIYPSDVLTVSANATSGDNVNVTLILYYPNLPGINARLYTWEAIRNNILYLHGVQVALTAGSGDYGTSAALNSTQNDLHANKDYAVLGFTSDTPQASVTIQGIDTGNLRVGFPVIADPQHDAYAFRDLAMAYNAPLIPVINANNAGSILLQAAGTGGASSNVVVQLAELATNVA
jgi:hypothetical protein